MAKNLNKLVWRIIGILTASLLVLVVFLAVTKIFPLAGPANAPSGTNQTSCTENGILQLGSAAGKEGFTIPYQVYQPPCYAQQSQATYPVLYLIATDETTSLI